MSAQPVIELNSKKVVAAGGGRKRNSPRDGLALEKELLLKTPEVPTEIAEDKIASAQWKLYAPVLVQRKILKRQHLPQLIMLCQQYSIYATMIAQAKTEGFTIPSSEGSVKSNPTYLVALKAETEYLRLCSLFMLDPTSEKRFQRAEENAAADNPFEAFK